MSAAVVSLPLAEAAASVGLSDRYLRDAVRSGDLIAHKAGRKLLFRVADLDEWISAMPVVEKKS